VELLEEKEKEVAKLHRLLDEQMKEEVKRKAKESELVEEKEKEVKKLHLLLDQQALSLQEYFLLLHFLPSFAYAYGRPFYL